MVADLHVRELVAFPFGAKAGGGECFRFRKLHGEYPDDQRRDRGTHNHRYVSPPPQGRFHRRPPWLMTGGYAVPMPGFVN
jgi:hypothetical protein